MAVAVAHVEQRLAAVGGQVGVQPPGADVPGDGLDAVVPFGADDFAEVVGDETARPTVDEESDPGPQAQVEKSRGGPWAGVVPWYSRLPPRDPASSAGRQVRLSPAGGVG